MQLSFSEFRTLVHGPKQERIQGDRLYALVRAVSVRLSYGLLSVAPTISPNQVSVAIVVLVLAVIVSSGYQFYQPSAMLALVQLLVLQLASIGDRVDGEIARYQNHFTQTGLYYDRLFHGLYPFALYLSLGHFLAVTTGYGEITTLSLLLAVLAATAAMQGKLRHHIKYKIALEGHQSLIRDLYPVGQGNRFAPSGTTRFLYYLVFMMYDWVWLLYLGVLLVYYYTGTYQYALVMYLAHALVSILWLGYFIFLAYPKRGLFSRADFK